MALAMIAGATLIGIAGTDLVLPAIPSLPAALGGTAAQAQYVLAAFVGGTVLGLLLFGELGSRFDQRIVLAISLLAYAAVSAVAGTANSLGELIVLRGLQGAAAIGPAVFAPGMLRALYGDTDAVWAIGRVASIEVLVPALAPIAGLWLLSEFGWRSGFYVLAGLAAVLGVLVLLRHRSLPRVIAGAGTAGYGTLLTHLRFLRLALGHAFTVGSVLVFVFGAPTVFVTGLGGTVTDFIIMQVICIGCFILMVNLSDRLVKRFGASRVILAGALIAALGGVAMPVYALAGGTNTVAVTLIFLVMNVGLGTNGPPGFLQAVMAARDDARGSALVLLAIVGVLTLGTAAVAPFIEAGLLPLATGAGGLAVAALLLRTSHRTAE